MTSISTGTVPEEDLSTSEQDALSLIRDREGLYQSQLWKEMDSSSRTGSRIAQSLAEKGLISRNETTHEGRKTYKLEIVASEKSSERDPNPASNLESELQGVLPLGRSIVETLEKRGETPISRIDRDLDRPPEEVDEAIRELLDREIITVSRETLYGRETDVVSLDKS